MWAQILDEVLQRVRKWPDEAQRQLFEIALKIDARLARNAYHATPDELKEIDEALHEIDRGDCATEQEVRAAFAKFRGT
jgi:hypothetical protein